MRRPAVRMSRSAVRRRRSSGPCDSRRKSRRRQTAGTESDVETRVEAGHPHSNACYPSCVCHSMRLVSLSLMQTATATAPRDAGRTKISTIIVDDESAARSRLRRLLSTEPDVEIVAECEDGRDAVAAILERSPDLVFLDVEMPELNGFEVLRSLPNDARPALV